jgi:hypothetical protein
MSQNGYKRQLIAAVEGMGVALGGDCARPEGGCETRKTPPGASRAWRWCTGACFDVRSRSRLFPGALVVLSVRRNLFEPEGASIGIGEIVQAKVPCPLTPTRETTERPACQAESQSGSMMK